MTPNPCSVRKTSRGMLLLSCFVLLTMVLAACGGAQTHHGGKQSPLAIVANTVGDWPRIFNPFSSSANAGAQGMIYETLLFYNRLDGSVKPWLATSQQLSNNNTVVAYHLRQDVKWTDGQRSTNSAPIGQQASFNYERWIDPNTDKLLDEYASTTDPTIQQQAMAGIQKIMIEQLPAIPLTNEPYWYEYNTAHFTGWPDPSHLYAVPSPYTAPDDEVVLLNLHPID